MKPVERARHVWTRFRQIAAFGRTGFATSDKLKMLVVGYARGHNFGANDLISRIGRTLFPEIAVRPSSLGGLTLHLDPSNLSHLVVADEIVREQVYDLNLVPFTPDLILDCGAHIGMFALLAGATFPKSKLVAFEPDPENSRWLRRQIEANHLPVDVVQAALSNEEGEVFFEAGQGCGGSLADASAVSSTAIRVKSVDLASYLAKCDIKNLLLKLDVEGAEENLLPKIINVLPQNSFLFFETHGGKESWNCLSGILEERGFVTKVTRAHDIYTDGIAVRNSSITAS
ncbi:MAG TPA: FkbM family methyltransferase [Chthoniobacterales bacterium]|jgi:FkbM family methyltransferase|nr:FkbM family methyltransferase [Chthoniobacterales bacterium]